MKYKGILILLAFSMSIRCSTEISTDPVKPSPTLSQSVPIATIPQPAQTPASRNENRPSRVIKGGPLCKSYLLAKRNSSKDPRTRLLKLKSLSSKNETLTPDLKKWLETADLDKLVYFELTNGSKHASLLRSLNIRATGLASNFESWAIEIDGHFIEFQSLSDDPKLLFWDKDGLLNYYVVDFSSEFIEERDFDNPSLDLRRFVINNDGKSQLVSEERNVKCK